MPINLDQVEEALLFLVAHYIFVEDLHSKLLVLLYIEPNILQRSRHRLELDALQYLVALVELGQNTDLLQLVVPLK